MPVVSNTDLKITETSIENSNICLKVIDGNLLINGIRMSLVDFVDYGDSYNSGPKADDYGVELKVLRTRKDRF